MARGWESKSVEEQIGQAQERQSTDPRRSLTTSELKRQKRKESLLIERRRLLREMEQGHKKRYLMLMERTLAHVDRELEKIESESRQDRDL
jgi:hypothetical protein